MTIPAAHTSRHFYHFTHIENLTNLLREGFLATNHPRFPASHLSVAAEAIQARRADMQVTCGPGGCVHDYVPFYFGCVSLMLLAVINKKNIDQFDILYFEFPISRLDQADAVFTDASANANQAPNFYSDPAHLIQLNWAEIDSRKWRSASDTLKRQRMAEALLHMQVPVTDAVRCVVWNQAAKERVEQAVAKAGVAFPPIEFHNSYDRPHWFTNFMDGGQSSLVKGPKEIRMMYDQAVEAVTKHDRDGSAAPFAKPSKLLEALRLNFAAIPETAELVGLASANGVHKLPVDQHTKDVVSRLRALPEYAALDGWAKQRVELAAYLHDIGKGPKSRWAAKGGIQSVDPNHPPNAMPMMARILMEEVRSVSDKSTKALCKLVCYHDIVGEVLGKGRQREQITDVFDSDLELDMLFALAKADIQSLADDWWDQNAANNLLAWAKDNKL